jgi:hypothetical protein
MTRAELHKLVWEKPMVHVAKHFGMTDVGLRKICLKHSIPTPPVGYWAKVANGKQVEQLPLPPSRSGAVENIRLRESQIEELPQDVVAVRTIALEHGALPENKIVVPSEQQEKLHLSAAATEQMLRKVMTDQEGFVSCQGSNLPNIKIGPGSIERVTLLIDTFLKALISRGHSVVGDETGLHLLIEEEPFDLRVYETRDKRAHVPTPAELKKQAQYEVDSRRYPALYPSGKKVWRNWDYYPSGRLCFEITDPTIYRWNSENVVGRWYDRSKTKPEDYLGEAVVALVTQSALLKHRRAEANEKARIRAEEAERRRREEMRRERIIKRNNFLIEKADQYAQFRKLATFADFLQRKTSERDNEPVDQIGHVLKTLVKDKSQQFERSTINAEILGLALFNEDDL